MSMFVGIFIDCLNLAFGIVSKSLIFFSSSNSRCLRIFNSVLISLYDCKNKCHIVKKSSNLILFSSSPKYLIVFKYFKSEEKLLIQRLHEQKIQNTNFCLHFSEAPFQLIDFLSVFKFKAIKQFYEAVIVVGLLRVLSKKLYFLRKKNVFLKAISTQWRFINFYVNKNRKVSKAQDPTIQNKSTYLIQLEKSSFQVFPFVLQISKACWCKSKFNRKTGV